MTTEEAILNKLCDIDVKITKLISMLQSSGGEVSAPAVKEVAEEVKDFFADAAPKKDKTEKEKRDDLRTLAKDFLLKNGRDALVEILKTNGNFRDISSITLDYIDTITNKLKQG